jgi:hypothetical protein
VQPTLPLFFPRSNMCGNPTARPAAAPIELGVQAYSNILAFHSAQMSNLAEPLCVETMPGVTCRRLCKPSAAQCRPLRTAWPNGARLCEACMGGPPEDAVL